MTRWVIPIEARYIRKKTFGRDGLILEQIDVEGKRIIKRYKRMGQHSSYATFPYRNMWEFCVWLQNLNM